MVGEQVGVDLEVEVMGGGLVGWRTGDKPKQQLLPKPGSKPRKGHILNEWDTSDMQKAVDEFNREIQVHFISFAF